MSIPNVVVDNTHHSIVYNPADAWTPQNISKPTDGSVPPLYGTFQEYNGGDNATLTFTYTGQDIVASFVNTDSTAISSCTLDGEPLSFYELATTVQCRNSDTIQYGMHIFTVTPNPDLSLSLLFDYIFYNPTESISTMTNVDVIYWANDSSINIQSNQAPQLSSSGDTLDFTFFGYSLGIYCIFTNNSTTSTTPAPASYSIDGNTPVNFTIINPTTNLTPKIFGAIVLQTPRYSLSQHHFHLDYWGNENTTDLELYYIIFQDTTTPLVLLDPFPTISSSNSTGTGMPSPTVSSPTAISSTLPSPTALQPTASQSKAKAHLGLMIGGATAGAIILVLVIFIFYIYQRWHSRASVLFRKTGNSNELNPVVEPFHNGGHNHFVTPETEDVEQNLLIEPFYHWRTHFRSIREDLHGRCGEPIVADTRNADSPSPTAPIARGRSLRYRVHEDSGDQITQPDNGTVIVDLPPTYTAIGFTAPPAPPPHEQPLLRSWFIRNHKGG